MTEASSSTHSSHHDAAATISPAGRPLTVHDLPAPDTERWVIRRKAEVVTGVHAGLISLDEACRRYALSIEEFLSWERMLDRYGTRGLRATRRAGDRAEA